VLDGGVLAWWEAEMVVGVVDNVSVVTFAAVVREEAGAEVVIV